MLSERINEFLLLGTGLQNDGDYESKESNISARNIAVTTQSFISEWYTSQTLEKRLGDKLQRVGYTIARIQSKFSDVNTCQKLKEYVTLQNKIRLLVLSNEIHKLDSFEEIAHVPDLVLCIMKHVPKWLPPNSRIKQLMAETVSRLRRRLIKDFHEKFEDHLNDSLAEHNARESWVLFLQDARDWLLAYATVSLLPYTLSESKSLLIDKYQEVLDEMLTPLWSRFHFHLLDAREADSLDQLLWTFGYSKSFVQMLVNLCSQITSTGKLQKLYQGDYTAAGIRHVTEKAVRFMRAHFAQAVLKYSPLEESTCIRLVENALELDDFFRTVVPQPLTITGVICDARPMHAQWLQIDRTYFTCAATNALSKTDAFSSAFGRITLQHEATCTGTDEITSSHFCYAGVYHCLRLLVVGSQRYAYNSLISQDQFCEAVLEPLLSVCVGLFLLRIRSHETLHAISNGSLPLHFDWSVLSNSQGIGIEGETHKATDDIARRSISAYITSSKDGLYQYDGTHGSKISRAENTPAQTQTHALFTLPVLQECLDSIDYFQRSIGLSANRTLACQPDRFAKCARRLQEWLPQRKLAVSELADGPPGSRKGPFRPSELVNRAMGGILSTGSVGASGGAGTGAGGVGGGSSNEMKPNDNFGNAVDLARVKVLTISSILEGQWRKLQNRRVEREVERRKDQKQQRYEREDVESISGTNSPRK